MAMFAWRASPKNLKLLQHQPLLCTVYMRVRVVHCTTFKYNIPKHRYIGCMFHICYMCNYILSLGNISYNILLRSTSIIQADPCNIGGLCKCSNALQCSLSTKWQTQCVIVVMQFLEMSSMCRWSKCSSASRANTWMTKCSKILQMVWKE